ncbi:MAG: hypothetical protein HQK76_10120 [Desulfobacterales bacterium]|nr:hypothetical protein [Desulfobacterales bacterium]
MRETKFFKGIVILLLVSFITSCASTKRYPAIGKVAEETSNSFLNGISKNQNYFIVVRYFDDSYTKKSFEFTKEIEKVFRSMLISKIKEEGIKNVTILTREDVDKVEEQMHFECSRETFSCSKEWREKVGTLLDANFLLTGSFIKKAETLGLNIEIINIKTGAIEGSELEELKFCDIDPAFRDELGISANCESNWGWWAIGSVLFVILAGVGYLVIKHNQSEENNGEVGADW